MTYVPCALTIAGTDPSGGAGIQADLKTFQELKTYGMSVITSVVAQNTTGVQDINHLSVAFIEQQLESVFSDMPVHALKTGMIANEAMMRAVAARLASVDAAYVMDPVMVATSGDSLIDEESRQFLKKELLPLTTIVTPNLPETEFITGRKIETTEDMKDAAAFIVDELHAGAALIKGGHLQGEAVDFLYDGHQIHMYSEERIPTKNTHGTGCTYSAAITANLSKRLPLHEAVRQAKRFVTAAIRSSFDIGSGNGPTNHWAIRTKEEQRSE